MISTRDDKSHSPSSFGDCCSCREALLTTLVISLRFCARSLMSLPNSMNCKPKMEVSFGQGSGRAGRDDKLGSGMPPSDEPQISQGLLTGIAFLREPIVIDIPS